MLKPWKSISPSKHIAIHMVKSNFRGFCIISWLLACFDIFLKEFDDLTKRSLIYSFNRYVHWFTMYTLFTMYISMWGLAYHCLQVSKHCLAMELKIKIIKNENWENNSVLKIRFVGKFGSFKVWGYDFWTHRSFLFIFVFFSLKSAFYTISLFSNCTGHVIVISSIFSHVPNVFYPFQTFSYWKIP